MSRSREVCTLLISIWCLVLATSRSLSPCITNYGTRCDGDKCFNRLEVYKRFDTIHLEVKFSGGPCNVSWWFNYSHQLQPKTIAAQNYDSFRLNVDIDDPEKQEGFYMALVSNNFGSNSSITYLQYQCVSAGDVYDHGLNNFTLSKTVGDMLTINFDISSKINLLVCSGQNYSVLNWSKHDCVKCLPNHRYHQCVDYEGLPTDYYHSFQITFNYSLCNLQYSITLFRQHLTTADSGTLMLARYTGESYKSFKNVELHVGYHSYNYVYVALNVVIVIIISISIFLVYQKMRKLSKRRGIVPRPHNNCPEKVPPNQVMTGCGLSTRGTLRPPSDISVNLQGGGPGAEV